MERALLEQQVRADQATTALQALHQQHQQTTAAAQLAQRRAAAARTAGISASAVVDKAAEQIGGVRWARDEMEIVQVPARSLLWWYRQSLEGSAGAGRNQGRGRNAEHPHGLRHASSLCSSVLHADHGVPRVCAGAVGARRRH